ncbi:MAG: DUF4163 domain-containing protein [Lachnospiraceae bacterium]|nr:DUF4163 domain-containing protein [Lachnospiraceae bacterium]
MRRNKMNRMMIKRVLAVMLVLVMVLALAGCKKGKDNSNGNNGNKPTAAVNTNDPGKKQDGENPKKEDEATNGGTSGAAGEAGKTGGNGQNGEGGQETGNGQNGEGGQGTGNGQNGEAGQGSENGQSSGAGANGDAGQSGTAGQTGVSGIKPAVIPIAVWNYYDSDWDYEKNERNGYYSFDYPVIVDGYGDLYPQLNDKFNTFYENRLAGADEKMEEIRQAQADAWDGQEPFRSESMNVVRSDTNLVCVAYSYYYYLGGAHGNYGTMCLCFDPLTGKDVLLKNIVKDKEAFIDLVYDRIVALNDAYETGSLRSLLNENFDEDFMSYEVGYNYLTVYLNPYEYGSVSWQDRIDIPFKGNEKLFDDKYLQAPENYMVRMDGTYRVISDMGDDGIVNRVDIYPDYINEYEDIGGLTFYLNENPISKTFDLEYDAYDMYCAYIHAGGKDYIYLTYWHDSDDDSTIIYRIDLAKNGYDPEKEDNSYGDIVQVADSGLDFNERATYDPMYMHMSLRTDVMGTDFCTMHYYMGDDGEIHPADDFYLFWGYDSVGGEITLKEDLPMIRLDAYGKEAGEFTATAGTQLLKWRTDLSSYVDFHMGDEMVRLRIKRVYDDEYEWWWEYTTLDGTSLYQLFDGLSFAD